MFVGRQRELTALTKAYESGEGKVIVLYGREGMGKTRLAKQLVEDKPYVYYQARELSEAEQNRYFEEIKAELEKKLRREQRVCFVVDEFDLMQKGYKNFFPDFFAFYQGLPREKVLLLLLSSSVQWVENSMVEDMRDIWVDRSHKRKRERARYGDCRLDSGHYRGCGKCVYAIYDWHDDRVGEYYAGKPE